MSGVRFYSESASGHAGDMVARLLSSAKSSEDMRRGGVPGRVQRMHWPTPDPARTELNDTSGSETHGTKSYRRFLDIERS